MDKINKFIKHPLVYGIILLFIAATGIIGWLTSKLGIWSKILLEKIMFMINYEVKIWWGIIFLIVVAIAIYIYHKKNINKHKNIGSSIPEPVNKVNTKKIDTQTLQYEKNKENGKNIKEEKLGKKKDLILNLYNSNATYKIGFSVEKILKKTKLKDKIELNHMLRELVRFNFLSLGKGWGSEYFLTNRGEDYIAKHLKGND